MHNDFFGEGVSSQTKYLIGIVSIVVEAFALSICWVSTRVLKDVHYSIVQFNYALVNLLSMAAILFG